MNFIYENTLGYELHLQISQSVVFLKYMYVVIFQEKTNTTKDED